MQTLHTIDELHRALDGSYRSKAKIGFVPTMGALHKGHLSLIDRSKAETDITVACIFVNPTQFGPTEDFDRYPRPIEHDTALLTESGVDLLFYPSADQIYPTKGPHSTKVYVPELSQRLCALTRPTHFEGVTTVVAKLFNIVRPTHAFFGLKDFQQFVLIRQMAKDLHFPIQLIGCDTIRESDGLAMSSRNRYLSDTQRKSAPILYQTLCLGKTLFHTGEHRADRLLAEMNALLSTAPDMIPDYLEIVDSETLLPVKTVTSKHRMVVAVKCGPSRLIDNMRFES